MDKKVIVVGTSQTLTQLLGIGRLNLDGSSAPVIQVSEVKQPQLIQPNRAQRRRAERMQRKGGKR